MTNQFRRPFAPFGEGELVIVERWIGRQKNHPVGVLAILNQAQDIGVEVDHLVEIVDVEHDMAKPFYFRHR